MSLQQKRRKGNLVLLLSLSRHSSRPQSQPQYFSQMMSSKPRSKSVNPFQSNREYCSRTSTETLQRIRLWLLLVGLNQGCRALPQTFLWRIINSLGCRGMSQSPPMRMELPDLRICRLWGRRQIIFIYFLHWRVFIMDITRRHRRTQPCVPHSLSLRTVLLAHWLGVQLSTQVSRCQQLRSHSKLHRIYSPYRTLMV